MKYRVDELEGALLNAAVEMAELPPGVTSGRRPVPRRFSTSWALGGPIIERERIGLWAGEKPFHADPTGWYSEGDFNTGAHMVKAHGATPLIAAMRCYVKSKLGEEVDVPTVEQQEART